MKLFQHLQVAWSGDGDNIKTDCIHCGSSALSVDAESPNTYQCFKCHQTGNAFTYIRKWYDNLPPLTKVQATKLCEIKKGLKPVVIRGVGIKYFNSCYWFPVYNQKNHLMAIHKFVPDTNIVYSSPKPTSLTILGLQNLSKSDTIMVAEGPWDYLTLLPHMVDAGIDLIATCGSYFSSNQLTTLKDKHIVLLYDNDTAGRDGVNYVARNLKSSSVPHLSLSYLDWSKVTPPTGVLTDKYDIRDLANSFKKFTE